MSQNSQILNYLNQNDSITPLDALEKFGTFRLSERIREIEKTGIKIIHEWVHLRYRQGDNVKRVMSYRLANPFTEL